MKDLIERLKNGERLDFDQTINILKNNTLNQVLWAADELRKHYHKNFFDSCSIINAQSGKCSEDCKWCSQSKFFQTKIDIYPLISPEKALEQAKANHQAGIKRLSLVTSGHSLRGKQLTRACDIYREISKNYPFELCASMGLLNKEELKELYDAGIRRYHCNMETAPSFFPQLCSTHTQDEKLATIRAAQELGMTICSGGIIGMGETMEQRVEMAIYLRDVVGADSVPINVLMPVDGTPLEGTAPLEDEELLLSFAMFALVMPQSPIRFAGGRTRFTHLMASALKGGVSGAIMGDMLTTLGTSVDEDKELLRVLNLQM